MAKTAVPDPVPDGKILINEADIPKLVQNVSSLLQDRQRLSQHLGMQFDGKRNVYEAAGYPQAILFQEYLGKYAREGVAGRVVRAPARATWRVPPLIFDGLDPEADTVFNKAIKEITDVEIVPVSLEEQRPNLWADLSMADELAGIGRYGVIVLGIADGQSMDKELKKSIKEDSYSARRLLSMMPLHEGQASIGNVERDRKSPRFGKPTYYHCNLGTDVGTVEVHWTRVIHIAENAPGLGIYGVPRLQTVYNDLENLLKVMAGSGESAWRLLYKGLIASSKEGYQLDEDDAETENKIDAYIHEFSRFLMLDGMDVKIEGGEIVDPTGLITIIVALISAATGIPQRILLGSERGELASGQDETNWKEIVRARQAQFAEVHILRETLKHLIYCGVLPMPANGRYSVTWPSLFTPTDVETAEINFKRAETIAKLSPAGAPDAYVTRDEVRELALLPPMSQVDDDILDEEDAVGDEGDEEADE